MCIILCTFVHIIEPKDEKKERSQYSVPDEVVLKYVTVELHDTKKQLEEAEKRIDAATQYAKGFVEKNVYLQEKVDSTNCITTY